MKKQITLHFPSERAKEQFDKTISEGNYIFQYAIHKADGTIEAIYEKITKRKTIKLPTNEIQTELF